MNVEYLCSSLLVVSFTPRYIFIYVHISLYRDKQSCVCPMGGGGGVTVTIQSGYEGVVVCSGLQ